MTYSDIVLEHFFYPKNVGVFTDQSPKGEGIAGIKGNGDVIQFQVQIAADRVVAAKFKAYGSCATIAVGSYLTEWIQNKSLSVVQQLRLKDVFDNLKLPQLKFHCVLLALEAMNKAIDDYFLKYR